MKRKLKGGISIVGIGVGFTIMLLALLFLELLELYDCQYAVEVRAQRAVNSTVEYAMDDTWRADGWNYMDVCKAQSRYIQYLDEDLEITGVSGSWHIHRDGNGQEVYRVRYRNENFYSGQYGSEAGMEVTVDVRMKVGLGKFFGQDGYEWSNTYRSTNFRVDDNQRWGGRVY